MKVKVIGSHGGVSPGFRTTSFLINDRLLIDAGSIAGGVPISEQVQIENILISHPHLDHIKDLCFLCDNCFGMKSTPFKVYAHTTTKSAIQLHLMNNLIWPDFSKLPSPDKPTMSFFELKEGEWIELSDLQILPLHVNHECDAIGFIIRDKKSSILFTVDTGPTEKIWEEAKKLDNLKAIFTEVSFPNHQF